jgi:glycosyltransferase involved in cell wall biosynthesis
MSSKKVLIFISHYLPGQNIGGPLKSVQNITYSLRKQFDFYIITSDRDYGSKEPYKNVVTNRWELIGETPVMYLRGGWNYYIDVFKLLSRNSFDVLYINSFFEFRFSIFILLLRFVNVIKFKRFVIAPRGELMEDALNFKRFRKEVYIRVSSFLGIYKNVIWHSTAKIETLGINERFKNSTVVQAGVLVDTSPAKQPIDEIKFDCKQSYFLKVIFVSRISKEKNLIFALRVLSKVTCNVEFHIYGPIEERDIWDECLFEIDKLPSNVLATYKGVIDKDLVKSYFANYDLFLFPTHIENFGHVINESLSVGTPVLISDRTPWVSLENRGLGWDFSLEGIDNFVESVENLSQLTPEQRLNLRLKVKKNYSSYYNDDQIIQQNLNLFNL